MTSRASGLAVLAPAVIAAVLAAAIAARAFAEPPPAVWAEPDPAAVVGRWRATASWRGCPAAGAPRATLDVRRDGSGYALDLAPALDGLGPSVLVPAAARRLELEHDDLLVTWTTGKHNRATLEIRFSSGCAGTLRLTRAGSGAPACDELAALEAIAGGCDGVTAAPSTASERTAIAGAARAGRARTAATRVCTARAAPLRGQLVDAGCVPTPAEAGVPGIRVPECEALVAAVARFMRCDRVPADMKQRLQVGMQRVARWATVPAGADADENLARAAATCVEARDDLLETMVVAGCP